MMIYHDDPKFMENLPQAELVALELEAELLSKAPVYRPQESIQQQTTRQALPLHRDRDIAS